MNSLSWLIYWADVLPSIRSLVLGTTTISLVVSSITLMVYLAKDIIVPKLIAIGIPILITILIIFSFIPEKETFYLIAASEVGEDVTKSPEFNKARTVINKWLDEQLQEKRAAK